MRKVFLCHVLVDQTHDDAVTHDIPQEPGAAAKLPDDRSGAQSEQSHFELEFHPFTPTYVPVCGTRMD
jgi:hypothetical protein